MAEFIKTPLEVRDLLDEYDGRVLVPYGAGAPAGLFRLADEDTLAKLREWLPMHDDAMISVRFVESCIILPILV